MTANPTPKALAQQLRDLADRLDRHGATVDRTAPILAARGWPTSASGADTIRTHGTGAGVSADGAEAQLNGVERAATTRGDYDTVHDDWLKLLRAGWRLATGGILLIDKITAHADPASADRKVRRPGSGHCGACSRVVAGTPNDRLRSGWCDACRKAWERAGYPDRAAFERKRHAEAHPPASVHIDPTQRWGHGDTPPEQGIVDTAPSTV